MQVGFWLRVVVVWPALLALQGCQEYLDRRDTITHVVGDAGEVNKATQVINRWPRAAGEDHWTTDGERTRASIEKYRARTNGDDLKERTVKQQSATSSSK